MKRRLSLATGALIVLLATATASAQEDDIEYGTLMIRNEGGVLSWQAHEQAASYRVYGHVTYWPPPSCAPDRLATPGERVDFDELLPAGKTDYTLPSPENSGLTFRKDMMVTIEALAGGGSVIAQDGTAFTADPFCTPEEYAAAGMGPNPGDSPLALATATLAAFGAIAFGGGLLLRRSRVR